MSQSSRRPPTMPSEFSVLQPEQFEGCCYFADQSRLPFGQNKAKKAYSRPVITYKKRNLDWIVFPMTTKKSSKSFVLYQENCQPKYSLRYDKGYVSCNINVISQQALLNKIGKLKKETIVEISEWYQENMSKREGKQQ